LLEATAGARGTAVSVLLGCYGIGAFLGNALGGRATDRFGSIRTLLVATVGFVALVATLPLTGTTIVGAAAALFAWSTFTWAFNPPMQNLLLQIGPAQGALLLSLNASAIYLGIGLSGVVGGLVIDSAGVLALPAISAILGVASTALLVALWRGMRRPTAGAGLPGARRPALVSQPVDPAARPGR
jgi:predicted MFS family arabinose efflux permease